MSELSISQRAEAIKPSATLAVSQRAGELRAEGKEVLNFAAGEPDFKPPAAVRTAVSNLSQKEPVKYAPVPGVPALRDAVAAELGEVHGRTFERGQILVSCGAKHSLANLFLATLDPGDEVVIPAPYWVKLPRHGRPRRGDGGDGRIDARARLADQPGGVGGEAQPQDAVHDPQQPRQSHGRGGIGPRTSGRWAKSSPRRPRRRGSSSTTSTAA